MAITYQAISSQVLTGTATSITFSSIPNTYTDLLIRASTRDTNASIAVGGFFVTFNSDTATNYSITKLRAGSGASSARDTSQSNISMGSRALDTAGNTSNTFAISELYIPNYTSTSSRQIINLFGSEENSTLGNNILGEDAALYRGSAAISSINIAANTAFAAGSRFDLYGITHL